MIEKIKVKEDLSYQSIVLVYKDEQGKMYLGHSFYYGGRDGSEYLLFLYKDHLPLSNVLEGWNFLDENSINIVIVNESNHTTAIDDFLHAFETKIGIEGIEYYPVHDFSMIDDVMEKINFKENSVIAFIQE